MEILLGALAEAIFSLLIEDLAQRPGLANLRDKLRGASPEKLALQRALVGAYVSFSGEYPALAASFFDEHFLQNHTVISELAKVLTPNQSPEISILEQAWQGQFHSVPQIDLLQSLTYFLGVFEREVKAQPLLKPFVDSRAFEQLYVIAQQGEEQVVVQRQMRDLLVDIRNLLKEVQPSKQLSSPRSKGSPLMNQPDIQDALIDILLEVPQLQDRNNRDTLLFRLSSLGYAVPRQNVAVADLMSIVQVLGAVGQLDTGEWPLVILMRNAKRYCPASTKLGQRLDALLSEYESSYNRQPIVPLPEIVIGADERLPIGFLEKALIAQKSVARLVVPRIVNGQPAGSVTGTGWIIGPNLLLTNHHVIAARAPGETPAAAADIKLQSQATIAWFGYDTWDATHVDYRCLKLVQSNEALDYALLQMEEESVSSGKPLSSWHQLRVVRIQPDLIKGTRLNIIQHPQGDPKMLAIRGNFYLGRVSSSTQPSRIQYSTDTEPGASGSPVFNDEWQVVALHCASVRVPESQYQGEVIKYNNQGVEIRAILENLDGNIQARISDSRPSD